MFWGLPHPRLQCDNVMMMMRFGGVMKYSNNCSDDIWCMRWTIHFPWLTKGGFAAGRCRWMSHQTTHTHTCTNSDFTHILVNVSSKYAHTTHTHICTKSYFTNILVNVSLEYAHTHSCTDSDFTHILVHVSSDREYIMPITPPCFHRLWDNQ